MITAVQELTGQDNRDHEYRCHVIYGKPCSRVNGERGPIWLFEPNTLVGYEVVLNRRVYGLVFRTLAEPDPSTHCLAGVQPGVRLLVTASTERQLARLKELLSLLNERTVDPPSIPDVLLLRAASALISREPVALIVAALLK
jgi:hypothetical protein